MDEFSNAKERLTEQRETIREFSREAMQVFSLLLLLVAAPTAIVGALQPESLGILADSLMSASCAISFGSSGCAMQVRSYAIVTGVLLVGTGMLNVVAAGFEARGIYAATNPDDRIEALQPNRSYEEHIRNRLITLAKRIFHNAQLISGVESLLALGKVGLHFVIYLSATLGYMVWTGNAIVGWHWVVLLIVIFIPGLLFLIKAPRDYRLADALLFPTPLYEYTPESHDEPTDLPDGDEPESSGDSKAG